MLRAKELMVGDWVLRTNGPEIIPVKVFGVRDGKYSLTIDNMHGQEICVDFIDVEPIPLTPEILEKNGWTVFNQDIESNDTQWGFNYGEYTFTWWSKVPLLGIYRDNPGKGLSYVMVMEMPIEHVHQLQHALRLCGIEKEIEL